MIRRGTLRDSPLVTGAAASVQRAEGTGAPRHSKGHREGNSLVRIVSRPRRRPDTHLRYAWIPASAGMTRTGWRVSLRSTRPIMTRMWSWGVQRGEALCERLEASHPLLSPLPSRERKARVEVQEGTSCRGFGGVPQTSLFFPQEWGPGG
jgi:hypothetical protein